MNAKALAGLAVIVALLAGWLVISMTNAPADTDTTVPVESEYAAPTEAPDGASVGVGEAGVVETSVEILNDNVTAKVEVVE
jgi:hypothetical protein